MVVEKPFTVSTAEADRVIATAKKSGKILTVFQSKKFSFAHFSLWNSQPGLTLPQDRRYDSDFRTLHYDVDFPFWMSSWKSPDWSPGQGMMYGLGSHTIDQALLLFGRPASVTGFFRSLRDVESKTDDTFTIFLQYSGEKKNLFVTVKTSVVTTMQYPLKFFVRGYTGSFIKYGDDRQESQIAAGQTVRSTGFGVECEKTYGLLTTKERVHESQVLDVGSGKWVGKFPSLKGEYAQFFQLSR